MKDVLVYVLCLRDVTDLCCPVHLEAQQVPAIQTIQIHRVRLTVPVVRPVLVGLLVQFGRLVHDCQLVRRVLNNATNRYFSTELHTAKYQYKHELSMSNDYYLFGFYRFVPLCVVLPDGPGSPCGPLSPCGPG